MEQSRIIGHVVSVNGFRLKVELSTEAKSPSRATPDGVQRAVAINSFLTFDLGAGAHAVGILSDLDARESYDPTREEELSLELAKPRRIASVQLLGTARQSGREGWFFDASITALPTLDTPAEVATPDVLSVIFTNPPLRNKPQNSKDDNFDYALEIGHRTGDENSTVKVSFNDLFSRPLAIVGNTGSGKSYTVASLLRGIIDEQSLLNKAEPHIFILDINGEYANVFLGGRKAHYKREPNKIYLNGKEFCLPAWLMNGEEICEWLQASESAQKPVLIHWWDREKGRSTLDAPRFVEFSKFEKPNLIEQSTDQGSNGRTQQYISPLELRLEIRLKDSRWQSFFNYKDQKIRSYEQWMKKLGVGQATGKRISILDLSMLASEILPFACAILGRLLLETREMLNSDVRNKYPWLLVLEEAHNYVRSSRSAENQSLTLSRRAFERVAKEGRKFGLSLVVASQRPSEISPTIISQCANFFSHRLQNPDDIEYFRRIIPKQAQRLLDQVTVLSAGEAIVFGSAVHVPSRVQIKKPSREPWSSTASPYVDWATNNKFPLDSVIENWGLSDAKDDKVAKDGNVVESPVGVGEE